ncbi:MAG: AAA family ATPase [Arenibacterium sp.]
MLTTNHGFGDPWRLSVRGAVLFADISGFVSLTEKLTRENPRGSQHLIDFLDEALRGVAQSVGKRNGDIISIVGDSLIAFWPESDDPVASVSCAAQCSFDLHASSDAAKDDLRAPRFRAALSFGDLELSGIGGCDGRMLLAPTGEAIEEACARFHDAAPGKTVICGSAQTFIGTDVEAAMEKTAFSPLQTAGDPLNEAELAPQVAGGGNRQEIQHYLPKFLAEHLRERHQKWAAQFRKVTTVFVCHDGVLSTLEDLHGFVLTAQQVIRRHGGVVEQVTFDEKGISCVGAFGLPGGSQKDDASRAVQAALEVSQSFDQHRIPARVGVGTGLLYCGDVGSETRRHFALYGPSINLAARLALSETGVVCDEATSEAAGHNIEFSHRNVDEIAGVQGVYRAFLPVRVRPAPIRKTRRFVGRTAEIASVLRRLDDLEIGRGGLMLIGGEPGIGKTRLMTEVLTVARQRGLRVVSETISNAATGAPLDLWIRILGHIARVPDGTGKHDPPMAEETIGLPSSATRATPETWAIRFKLELIRRLQSKDARPLVIGIDNLHWIDSASLDLLGELVHEAGNFLILATASPTTPDENKAVRRLRQADTCENMLLGPLSHEELDAQIKTVLGVGELAKPLGKTLYDLTKGHPLYCEELVLAMQAGKHLRIEGETAVLAQTDQNSFSVDAAPSLNGAISMRLDQLSWIQQLVLKSASALGQQFERADLMAVFPGDAKAGTLEREVEALVEAAFLYPDGDGTLNFKHALTRDIVYGQLPDRQRRELHVAAYNTLLARFDGAASDAAMLSSLSVHAEQAGRFTDAIKYIESLVLLSRDRNANAAAIWHQRHAFKLVQKQDIALSTETEASWWLNLGDAHNELSQNREAADAYRRALAILEDEPPRGNATLVARTSLEIFWQTARRCLPLSNRAGGDNTQSGADFRARAYQRLAEIAFFQNDSLSVLHHTLRAANLAEMSGEVVHKSISHASLAIGLGINGLGRLARFYRDISLAASDGAADDTTRAYTRLLAVVLAFGEGDWNTIQQTGDEAAQLYLKVGDEFRHHQIRFMQFYGHLLTGQLDHAQDRFDEIAGFESSREFQQSKYWAATSALLLEILLHLPARDRIREVQELMNDRMDLSDCLMGHGLTAVAWAKLGERDLAIAEAEAAVDLLVKSPPTIGGGYLFGSAGPVEVLLRYAADDAVPAVQRTAARAKIGSALRALKTYARRVPVSRARVRLLQGAAAALDGDAKNARGHWTAGAATAGQMGMKPDQAVLEQSIETGVSVFTLMDRASRNAPMRRSEFNVTSKRMEELK